MIKGAQKLEFTTDYNQEVIRNEFLYNVIHYCLIKEITVLSGPTRYDKSSCTYMVHADVDFELIKKLCKNLITDIHETSLLYEYSDPRSIFLDKAPELTREKVFKYLPYRTLYETKTLNEERNILIEKINTSLMTKKSTLYKVTFL